MQEELKDRLQEEQGQLDHTLPNLSLLKARCTTCGLELDTGVPVCPNDGTSLFVPPDVGAEFQNKYQFIERLAAGGMGSVFKAKQHGLKRFVAVKMLHSSHMNPLVIRRFQQEAQALAALNHKNLVAVHELGVTEYHQPYMVMDYVEGKAFSSLLKEQKQQPLDKLLKIFIQICEGLEYVHSKGIMHRDMKPSNVMLVEPDTDNPSVKLVDFGIAKVVGPDQSAGALTETGDVFGSPLYMSPEQAKGISVDARTDIYSLGCVMYEALTGSPPFTGGSSVEIILKQVSDRQEPLNKVVPQLKYPNALQHIVDKSLEKDVKDRYQSAQELKEDLRELLDRRRGWYHLLLPTFKRPKHRSRAVIVAAVGLLIMLGSPIMPYLFNRLKLLFPTAPSVEVARPPIKEVNDALDAFTLPPKIEKRAQHSRSIYLAMSPDGARQEELDLSYGVYSQNAYEELLKPKAQTISKIDATNSNVNDEVVEKVFCHIPLTDLDLNKTKITSESVHAIARKLRNLQRLKLNEIQLTESAMADLGKMKYLNYLSAEMCELDDDDLKALSHSHSISELRLENNPDVTDKGLSYLLRRSVPLVSLGLTATRVTDASIVTISRKPVLRGNLSSLWVPSYFHDSTLPLLKQLNNLDMLGLGNSDVTEDGLVRFLEGSKLSGLSLEHLLVGDRILPVLARMPNLTNLDIEDTLVTDEGLSKFKPLELRSLNVRRCDDRKLTEVGVEAFKHNNPTCTVIESRAEGLDSF